MNYDDTGARLIEGEIFDFYGFIVEKCSFLLKKALF
jgi:hypothetical protein